MGNACDTMLAAMKYIIVTIMRAPEPESMKHISVASIYDVSQDLIHVNSRCLMEIEKR